jgi:uncharacterized lipoprotein YehR (DUF1307 family)
MKHTKKVGWVVVVLPLLFLLAGCGESASTAVATGATTEGKNTQTAEVTTVDTTSANTLTTNEGSWILTED